MSQKATSPEDERPDFSYYVELEDAGVTRHVSASVQGNSAKDVEALVRAVAKKRGYTVTQIFVWRETDPNVKLALLSQYYKALQDKEGTEDEMHEDLLYSKSSETEAPNKEEEPPKYPPIVPPDPPKTGFASQTCFSKMEPFVARVKTTTDRREGYDALLNPKGESKQ